MPPPRQRSCSTHTQGRGESSHPLVYAALLSLDHASIDPTRYGAEDLSGALVCQAADLAHIGRREAFRQLLQYCAPVHAPPATRRSIGTGSGTITPAGDISGELTDLLFLPAHTA